MSNWKKIIIPIFLLFFTLLIDGGLTYLFHDQLNSSIGLMVPRLVVVTLIMLAFYLDPKQLFGLSLTFGFIYDSYYSGVLGVYIAAFVLITYLVIQIRQIINPYFYVILLVNVVILTIMELFVFGVYRGIGLSDLTLQLFLVNRLGGTLVFNTVAFLIIGYPLREWMKVLVNIDEKKRVEIKKVP
ncbi:rod shape-determining protein MreD [Alkalibacterium sp. 20]|uniref:rod shape-determining protein MreD n=1 Tax=Alkalibacterium sp. 20 TaxID=1798803 RepID=UPI00090015D3|nr:rod shape-determining protein MreD [Alkalibacterium sp. 20]OJF95734.1 hypothetical protein AX762_06375 [Alkalibacterium sp. 20]